MLERRAFLRGLTTLPLIGGSVALIGRPTAAAVPVTPALLDRYATWLGNEYAAALIEMDRSFDFDQEIIGGDRADWRFYRVRAPLFSFNDAPNVEAHVRTARPSSRAAVMLSAAGLPIL